MAGITQATAIMAYGADFDQQFAPLRAAITAPGSAHGGFVSTCMCHGCPWDRLQLRGVNGFAARPPRVRTTKGYSSTYLAMGFANVTARDGAAVFGYPPEH